MAAAHVALIIFTQLGWGLNLIAAKVAMVELPPFLFTGLRFLALFILLAAFIRWHPRRWRTIVVIALGAGVGHFGFLFYGVHLAGDIGPVAIATQLAAPFAAILSMIFLAERLDLRQGLALTLAFGGVVFISFDPRVFDYVGGVIMVGSAGFCWAVAALFMRRTQDLHVFDLQAWVALFTCPAMLAISFMVEQDQIAAIGSASVLTWGALAFTIVAGSIVGHAGINWLLQRYEVVQIAPFLLIQPVAGTAFGAMLLGDVVTWRIIVGGAITLAGVALVTIRPRPPAGR